MYAVTRQLYFSPLDGCFGYWCSYYEVQSSTVMTEILRSRGNTDAMITKSGSARSEQVLMIPIEKLLVMPTEQVIN